MTLRDYLIREKLNYAAFAERIHAGHARTVERYAKGQRMPDGTMMLRIVEVTGAEVTPNDFFGVEPAEKAA